MAYKYLKYCFLCHDIISIIISYIEKTEHEKLVERLHIQIKYRPVIKDIHRINFIMTISGIPPAGENIKKINNDLKKLKKKYIL